MAIVDDYNLNEQRIRAVLADLLNNGYKFPADMEETPGRVVRAWEEMFSGMKEDPYAVAKTFPFQVARKGNNQIVQVTNIPFVSVCKHHILPFHGKVHIGYIPNYRILGLSKFYRIVDILARRPQVQENLTEEIKEVIYECLHPGGVIVIVEAEHMCCVSRGIKQQGVVTKTKSVYGAFEQPENEASFMRMLV